MSTPAANKYKIACVLRDRNELIPLFKAFKGP